MALSNIAGVTNVELWNLARKVSPTFKSHTAEGTADLFTEKGFEALRLSDVGAINEFFEISLRIAFQGTKISKAKNPLADLGLVEKYNTPNGGYVQRMAIDSIKPVTPAFKGLQDGDSVDPYIVRKPKTSERFFPQNFDYQSFITIQDFQVKQIFVSTNGMGEFVAGVLKGLENGYIIQEYTNVMEALSKMINSTEYPLQDTQVVRLNSWTDADITDDELKDFILSAKDVVSNMVIQPQTSAYNAGEFATSIDEDELVMLVRAGIKNRIEVNLEVGAFNPDKLSLPLPTKEVDNFGGLVPYADEEYTQLLYPVYSNIGEQIGWNTTEGSSTVTVELGEAYYKDTNEDVIAVIAQKGAIFENIQNPYVVSPIYNPRGLYSNYWASSANNAIVGDPYYTMVVIAKPQA